MFMRAAWWVLCFGAVIIAAAQEPEPLDLEGARFGRIGWSAYPVRVVFSAQQDGAYHGLYYLVRPHGVEEPGGMIQIIRRDGHTWEARVQIGENEHTVPDVKEVETVHGPALAGNLPVGSSLLLVVVWLDPDLPVHPAVLPEPVNPQIVETTNYHLAFYSSEDGLAGNAGRSITQTPDGYIWIGTHDGLSRFDGVNWKSFGPNTTPALSDPAVKALTPTPDGRLLVGTKSDGIFFFDGKTFQPSLSNHLKPGTDWEINNPEFAEDGAIWFVSDWGKILCRLGSDGSLETWTAEELTGISAGQVRSEFLLDRHFVISSNKVLVAAGFGKGARILDRSDDSIVYVDWNPALPYSERGELVFSSFDEALVFYDPDWNAEEVIGGPLTLSKMQFFPGQRVGEYLGKSPWNFIRMRGRNITSFPDAAKKYPSARPYQDREGNLWLVTGSSGVVRLRAHEIEVVVDERPTHVGRLNTPKMVVADSEGNIHFTTWGTISKFDGVAFEDFWLEDEWNRQWQIPENRPITQFLRHSCLTLDPDDEAVRWVGLGNIRLDNADVVKQIDVNSGRRVPLLARVDQDSTQFFHHESFPLGALHAYAVAATPSGTVYVGNDQGLFVLNDGELDYWNETVGLDPFEVMAIQVDSRGRVLFGGADSGLFIIEEDRPFRVLRREDGLSSNTVMSLFADQSGAIWIGTDHGVNRLDGGELQSFTDGAAFLSSEVLATIEDHLGNLWFGTDGGIFAVKRSAFDDYRAGRIDDLGALKFGLSDGMKNEGIFTWCTPSAARTPDNSLLFCTQKDLVRFDPEQLLATVVPPIIDITGCSQPDRTYLDRSISLGLYDGQRLDLPPEAQHVLFVDYAARVFSYPEKVRHQYRLRGVFDEWRNAGAQRRAMFTRLAPGDYTFEVRAINHNDAVSPRIATLPIHLAPYYYQTLWFRLGVALTILGAAFLFYRWRLGYQNRILALEKKMEMNSERSRIARDMHDEIGSSLAQMRLLGELAGDLETENEETGQLASQIERLAVNSSRSLREIIWSLNAEKSSVDDLAEYLDVLVRDFFNGTGIRAEVTASKKETSLELSPQHRRQIVLICKGVMSNVLKHSKADRFSLEIESRAGELQLIFKDNGVGFDPEKVPVDSHGLQSIRERVSLLGGELTITSNVGKGTTMLVTVPLTKSAASGSP